MMKTWKVGICSCVIAVALTAQPAGAIPITFAGSGTNSGTGHALSANVTFDVSGTSLLVTLVNTSSLDVTQPSDVLTGVFFNIGGNPSLTKTSATVSLGSSIISSDGSQSGGAGTVVGGEWAYLNNLSQYSANAAISSSGLGIFGDANFPGPNLQKNAALDGVQYGITSAGDVASTVNGGLAGQGLIKNSVEFALGGLPSGFLLSDISTVTFQYGTALTEPSLPGTGPGPGQGQLPAPVPEPASMLLLGSGLSGLALLRRRGR
jgi:hypothetical protein